MSVSLVCASGEGHVCVCVCVCHMCVCVCVWWSGPIDWQLPGIVLYVCV
jgi:hypothetical protein